MCNRCGTLKSLQDLNVPILSKYILGIRTLLKPAKDAVQKLATFFKNVIFEKLESQFTIIKYADIVN